MWIKRETHSFAIIVIVNNNNNRWFTLLGNGTVPLYMITSAKFEYFNINIIFAANSFEFWICHAYSFCVRMNYNYLCTNLAYRMYKFICVTPCNSTNNFVHYRLEFMLTIENQKKNTYLTMSCLHSGSVP